MVQQINKPKEDINAFILHAFPGSGKTLASLLIGAYLKEQGFIERIIVTVPSDFLRDQMEDVLEQLVCILIRKILAQKVLTVSLLLTQR